MITIRRPIVVSSGERVRLTVDIDVDGETRNVWFEVAAEYRDYLCHERADAFVIGLLYWSMLHHHDIVCEAPIGEDLIFQIRTYLIPALANNSAALHPTVITAEIDSGTLPNAGAVGTGVSCGVDSFHAISAQANSPYPSMRLTHLALNNVGSHGGGSEGRRNYEKHRQHVQAFCKEYGFKLVLSDSNIADVFEQNMLVTHTYTSAFAIYALQKFWRRYFYASSGFGLESFSLTNSQHFSSARYELILLPTFSTPSLQIYSEGPNLRRLDKIRAVAQYEPAFRYLNVCGRFPSCNKCRKCKRTLLELYAIGQLDNFSACFDLAHFRKHLDWYMIRFLSKYWQHDTFYVNMYPLLKDKISLKVWLLAFLRCGPHAMFKNIKNKRKLRGKPRVPATC
ncbi:MAG: hypothetical protein PHU80_05050 [Kiritimatiellae bacterium]|nr:hypothetical protein [Kiritimatiellia bacterium]